MATGMYERERELTAAITPTVESALPGVEVLAVEIMGKGTSASTSTAPKGSTSRSASA